MNPEIEVHAEATIKAFLAMPALVDAAIFNATTAVGMAATGVMKRQIKGGHKAGTKTPSAPDTPPTNITGNLRRAIRPEVRKGFAGYTVVIGSYANYARQLELGGGRWKSGVKYPFVEPTARIMIQNGKAQNIYIRYIRKAIKS